MTTKNSFIHPSEIQLNTPAKAPRVPTSQNNGIRAGRNVMGFVLEGMLTAKSLEIEV
jgi:hypothetical protein